MNDTKNTPKRRGRRSLNEPSGREALIHSGVAEFARFGFEGASLRTIAQNAGVDSALVARLFGSKLGLWQEIVAHFETQRAITQEQITRLAADSHLSSSEKFKRYLTLFIEISCRTPALAAFLFQEQADGGERFELLLEKIIQPHIAASLPLIRRLKTDGVIDYADELQFLQMLFSAVSHQTLPALQRKQDFDDTFKQKLLAQSLKMFGKK